MHQQILAASLWTAAAMAGAVTAVDKRQANSAIGSSSFRRRGYAQAATLNRRLYIDGGEFSYASGGNIVYQYYWSSGSVSYNTISKPSGVPNLVQGNIWVDSNSSLLYIGATGRSSFFGNGVYQNQGLWSFKPDGSGSGTWSNLNDTSDAAFKNSPRPFGANVAYGGGAGYALGGFNRNNSNPDFATHDIPIAGLLTFNYTTQKLSNDTVRGTSMAGYNEMGGLVYSSNFGSQGILVSVGGDQVGKQQKGSDSLLSMDTVAVYDIASKTWYDQKTSGNVPESRKEYCTAGITSNNKTFEILVYAGWDGHLGSASVPYDEAYILTLPAFQWFKASYPAANPRHGVVCAPIGGGQVLTVGGVDTTQEGSDLYKGVFNTADNFGQGLQVFDMNGMAFTNAYSASPPAYSGAAAVRNYYASNSRTPTFTNTSLGTVFAVQNFPAQTSTSSGSGSGSSSGTSSSSSGGSNAGAIAGGVVGGVLGLALILGAGWFFLRRRRQQQERALAAHPSSSAPYGGPGAAAPPAGAGAAAYEADPTDGAKHEMDAAPAYNGMGYAPYQAGKHAPPSAAGPNGGYSADPKVVSEAEGGALPSELPSSNHGGGGGEGQPLMGGRHELA